MPEESQTGSAKERWAKAGVKHFSPEEFDSPDEPGSGALMDLEFVKKLDMMREELGFPMPIDSGYRSKRHNSQVGGVDASAHEEGVAADVGIAHRWSWVTTYRRYRIQRSAILHGITRIGLGKTFVHLDTSRTLPQERSWLYES